MDFEKLPRRFRYSSVIPRLTHFHLHLLLLKKSYKQPEHKRERL